MTLVSCGVSISPVDQHATLIDRRSRWTPRWLQRWLERRREADELDELARWANEVMWQWNDTMEGTGLARRTSTAGRVPLLVVPQVELVEAGPPVTLLVRVLPGQIVTTSKPRRTASPRVWMYPWSISHLMATV